MKAVLQRVKSASVTVDGQLVSSIGKGVLVLAGVSKEDTIKDAQSCAAKLLKFKLWDDENGGRWKKNVTEISGEVLCVSQFTLLASTKKGNKPDFHKSASGDQAKELYTAFFKAVQDLYQSERVKDGIFQAMMDVALINDGPVGLEYRCEDSEVTIEIDTDPPKLDLPGGGGSTQSTSVGLDDLVGQFQKLQRQYDLTELLA
ncbi:hypothetical protein EJ05DRAFT_505054 [Pseudovirgaria hyperparasitica]|uniref:D-aminoacyl-tRNA deacylase n=1 Tax=Pseudovirgaria hyperparasitica TaxID=470096 RepID=A0A6A6VUK8_9PEZI|nr:uncharacterized protein EJ05DRAFT_505054 [Pseudovirgaria hyperparasitica]KAF2753414.1 hypothetical protein EJ05DRAFT_505054 [Pseudovirgaria hyperparasitica]